MSVNTGGKISNNTNKYEDKTQERRRDNQWHIEKADEEVRAWK